MFTLTVMGFRGERLHVHFYTFSTLYYFLYPSEMPLLSVHNSFLAFSCKIEAFISDTAAVAMQKSW